MGKEIILSIIVPIYNVEKYLRMCMDSLLNQDSDKYEIIAIDDGSTDSSYQILQEYSINPKVICVSKQNEGVSITRNLGIEKASGRYIMFVDSDDYIDKGAINDIIQKLSSDKNIYIFTYSTIRDTEILTIDDKIFQDIKLKNNKLKYYIEKSANICPPVRYILKTSFVLKSNFKFLPHRLVEDTHWPLSILNESTDDEIEFVSKSFYNYRLNANNSLSKFVGLKSATDVFEMMADLLDDLKNKALRMQAKKFAYGMLRVYYSLSVEDKEKMVLSIKQNSKLFKTCKLKYLPFYVMFKCFGAKFALRMLKGFIKA